MICIGVGLALYVFYLVVIVDFSFDFLKAVVVFQGFAVISVVIVILFFGDVLIIDTVLMSEVLVAFLVVVLDFRR